MKYNKINQLKRFPKTLPEAEKHTFPSLKALMVTLWGMGNLRVITSGIRVICPVVAWLPQGGQLANYSKQQHISDFTMHCAVMHAVVYDTTAKSHMIPKVCIKTKEKHL